MEANYPIHDLYIEMLETVAAASWRSLDTYSFDDHLLKRIGLIEIIEVSAGDSLPEFVRAQADELWTLLEGEAAFHWKDHRKESPTFSATHTLAADSPVRVLVPFGVEFRVSVQSDCTLLRVASHAADLADVQIRDSTTES